jgi:zinc transport system substrate-binding protein
MEPMMSRKLLSLSVSAMALAGAAQADAPRVATDIAPVHSLVARVMDGVGAPDLIIQKGASPHAYSLRPSEAGALQGAEIVFWIGPDLTPWMADAAETLAGDARIVTLLDLPETTRLEFREGALFEAHSHEGEHGHDHEAGHDDDHKHDHEHEAGHDHDEHKHEHEKAGHDHDHDHEHGHEDHKHEDQKHDDHAHAHGAQDPHAWLSPANAAVWFDAIAATLSEADPENAATYAANASAGKAELGTLTGEIAQQLEPVKGKAFIVFHDAYQYFEDAFGLSAAGAISLSDATDPSPARIAEIQGRIRAEGIDCVLAEPQFNEAIVATVTEGTEVGTGVVDPLGSTLDLGPGFYPALIRDLAAQLAECLGTGA